MASHRCLVQVFFIFITVEPSCHLRGGEAGYGVQHVVGIHDAGLEARYLGIAALEGGLHDLQCSGKDYLVALVRTGYHISPLSAYGGQHLCGHPVLESAGALELRC